MCSITTTTGRSRRWCATSAATYHTGGVRLDGLAARHRDRMHRRAGVVIATCSARTAPGGIVCLAGVSVPAATSSDSMSARSTARWCWTTTCVFGTVNANRRHYEMAAEALARGRPRLARAG